MSKLSSAVAENHAAIMSMTKPQMKIMLPILKQVRDETAETLDKIFSAEKKKSTPSQWTVKKHQDLLKQLDALLIVTKKKLPQATHKQMASNLKNIAAPKGLKNLIAMASALSPKVASLNLPLAKIIASSSESVASRYSSSAQRYGGRVGQRVRNAFAVGLVRGESIDQITTRLLGVSSKSKSSSDNADKIAANQFFANRADAARLVRTEMIGGYNRVQYETLKRLETEDPGWLKRWDATLDRRLCAVCRSLDGVTIPVNAMFAPGVLYPPIHPNDRCSIVLVRA